MCTIASLAGCLFSPYIKRSQILEVESQVFQQYKSQAQVGRSSRVMTQNII